MTRVRAVFGQAVGAHREAVAQLRAARTALDVARSGDSAAERAALAEQARRAARRLAPGWLGADWADTAELPVGRDASASAPVPVRIGTAVPADDLGYPSVVPLLGAGHLALDAGSPGLFASVLLRLVAAAPAGLLRVCWLGAGLPAPFRPLRAAGLLLEADPDTALAAADRQLQHVAAAVRAGQDPAGLPYLLLVVAQPLPPARLRPLAEQGPAGRLHLLLAGQAAPLPHTVSVRSAATRADHSGADGAGAVPGEWVTVSYGEVTAPAVRLDPMPPDELVAAVCRRLADSLRPGFGQLVPAQRWAERSATGLRTPIGVGAGGAVELVCAERTPHWLLAGSPRAAGAVALAAVYGLATRYSPDELAVYLLDATGFALFAEFAPSRADPSWLPHARHVDAVESAADPAPVLAGLVAEVAERRRLLDRAGHADPATALSTVDRAVPRILVVLAGADLALAATRMSPVPGADPDGAARPEPRAEGGTVPRMRGDGAQRASDHGEPGPAPRRTGEPESLPVEAMLAGLVSTGGAVGVHLLLSAQRPAAPVLGRLPGRLTVSDVDGTAVLGERTVRLIDPYADPAARARLREALWQARTPGSAPPEVPHATEPTSLAGE
ncbi:FtsK/SpoIIIE domain-containing protein [Actinocatenispora sera]|uniref:FtsK/SpoIIIE domain-containing protein n=1 Tax=Actinocatenispora sera TaxID=390989 RepID=UPI00340FCCF8